MLWLRESQDACLSLLFMRDSQFTKYRYWTFAELASPMLKNDVNQIAHLFIYLIIFPRWRNADAVPVEAQ